MTKHAVIMVLTGALLGGCSTVSNPGGGKPVLTKRATKQALVACNASDGAFRPSKRGLPSFSVKSRIGEVAVDGPTPTVTCVYQRLQSYRYDLMVLEDAEASEASAAASSSK